MEINRDTSERKRKACCGPQQWRLGEEGNIIYEQETLTLFIRCIAEWKAADLARELVQEKEKPFGQKVNTTP